MTLTTEMIRAGQDVAPQLSAVEIAAVWRAMCAAAPVAAQAQPEGVTLDGCLETLYRLGEYLGVDYEAARKAPGKPSDAYIETIEKMLSHTRDVALEQAAVAMEQTSRYGGASVIRDIKSGDVTVTPQQPVSGADGFRDAVIAAVERYGVSRANEYAAVNGHQHEAARAESARLYADICAMIPAAQPQPSGADEFPAYVIYIRPGMVPQRKGPYPTTALIEAALRDLHAGHPDATSMVIRLPGDCYPTSGVEWIDMYGDKRNGRLQPDQPQPSGNAGEVPDERAAFDHWFCLERGLPMDANTTMYSEAFLPFRAWQARAALAQQASGRPAPLRNSKILDLAISSGMTARHGVYRGNAASVLCFAGALLNTSFAQQASGQDRDIDAAFEAVRKQLCKIPRYSFIHSAGAVRSIQDNAGAWIPFIQVHALFDPIAIDAARAAAKGE